MTTWLGRNATQELTRIGIVLLPRRARRLWLARSVLVAALVGTGAAASSLVYLGRQAAIEDPRLAQALSENGALRTELEQGQLKLRMAQAHSEELERQIHALNERLRETQEQLSFFRKAREGNH
jgi:septal ring factor EnvC (AmiA/AmiB activator)